MHRRPRNGDNLATIEQIVCDRWIPSMQSAGPPAPL